MSAIQKSGMCQGCNNLTTADLFQKHNANKSFNYVWVCSVCGKYAPFGGSLWIAKETVEGYLTAEQIDALPVIMPEAASRCVVCGDRTAELHHWAPKAVFKEESDKWPKDYLCRKCHMKWHKMISPEVDWA